MRRYTGPLIDSSRWERFPHRPDDVIIATPAKCGTTWMQHLVGMILLDAIEFGHPLTKVSPWLDALFTAEEQVFETLGAQSHRRFIKTHTPLDGLPWRESWTYITVFRHPLDAALSWRGHMENSDPLHVRALVAEVTGRQPDPPPPPPPADPADSLRFWIDSELAPNCSGLLGLSDYANTLSATWERRHESNVHLFHYDTLWDDLVGQVSRLAGILDLTLNAQRRGAIVEAATLDAMRSRAKETAPYGDATVFHDAEAFFGTGGRREWPDLLTSGEVDGVARRLESLVGPEAAAWALGEGRTAPVDTRAATDKRALDPKGSGYARRCAG